MLKYLQLSFLLFLLAACAASSPVSTPLAKAEAQMFQTKPGMAAIYVYRRPALFGAAQKTYIEIDGKPLAHFSAGFTKVDVPPGSYNVTTCPLAQKNIYRTSSYLVNVEAGEIAILRYDIMREPPQEIYRLADNQTGIYSMTSLDYYPAAIQQLDKSQFVDQVQQLKEMQAKKAQDHYTPLAEQARIAQQNKDYKKAVALYTEAIFSSRELFVGEESRLALIELVKKLKNKPLPPQEIKKYSIRAKAYIDLENFEAAAKELMNTINLAPWMAEPYYNYALLEEKLGYPDRAIWAIEWLLTIGADPGLMARAEEELIRLEVFAEEKTSVDNMNGIWVAANNSNDIYKVRVSGAQLTIYAPNNSRLDGTINGSIIEGYFKGGTNTQDGCLIPGESVKLYDSSVSSDRRKISFKYTYTLYKTQFQNNFLGPSTCISVTPYDKKEASFTIIKKL